MWRALTIFILCSLFLSACSTVKGGDNDEKQKVKTAKINAQLGIAYLERNDVNRAKKKLITAMEQGPGIPETWYSMAYYLEATGNKEQAKKYYLKALSLAPQRGDVQNNYGTFLCRTGAYQESINHFMLAVKDPEYLDTADAFENAGQCALKIPNKELAYDYFSSAVMHNPSRPNSLLKLAQLDYENGDYKDAKIKLDQYLAIAPVTPQSSALSAKLGHKVASTKSYTEEPIVNDEEIIANEKEVIKDEKPKRVTYRTFLKGSLPKPLAMNTPKVHREIHKEVHKEGPKVNHRHLIKIGKPAHKTKVASVKTKRVVAPKVIITDNRKLIRHKMPVIKSKRTETVYSWRV